MAFVDDNLLHPSSEITHHGAAIREEEEITPTLENFVVLTWLQLIHTDLPRLVKQRYGTELRSRTLASIKPEISQVLDSLLDEIRSSNGRAMRTITFPPKHQPKERYRSKPKSTKLCPLCKQAGRPNYNHFLSNVQTPPRI